MKKIIFITYILIFIGGCKSLSCEDLVNMYKNVELNIKLEKIYSRGTRNYVLEGKDKFNNKIKWQDFSSWILDIHQNINVGDSIIKAKGKTYLIIKKPHDTTSMIFYVKCQGREYRN